MWRGFTLAELLIALAILGVIAVFTIPKVLQAQQDERFNSMGKEVAAQISEAYQTYQLEDSISADFGMEDLTPYFNYVSIDTSSTVDLPYNQTTITCGLYGGICLRLHNGGVLYYWPQDVLGGTGNLNAVPAWFDPDGVSDASSSGPGKSLQLWLYANGRITTIGEIEAGTNYSNGSTQTHNPSPNYVPPWFSWD